MDRPTLGIFLRILSGVFAAGMFICVKAVGDKVPLGEVVFFRSFFAFIPLVIFLWLRNEFPKGLSTKRPLGHLMRSAFGAIALFGTFAALSRLHLAEAVLIAQLTPMIMAIAAVYLLSERITKWRIGGLILGFIGVVVLVGPELRSQVVQDQMLQSAGNSSARVLGFGLALVSAFVSAIALLMVRTLNKTESPGAIAFYFVLVSSLGALATLPWGWTMPTGNTWIFLVASGIFGGFTHIAMTLSFRYAEVSRLAPFEYLALLWPLLADLLIFQLPISQSFLIAAPLILGGSVLAANEKRQHR